MDNLRLGTFVLILVLMDNQNTLESVQSSERMHRLNPCSNG